MLCSVQFSAHSLDALAVIVANFSLTDFTGGYELHWRRSRLHTRIVAKPNAALSNSSSHYCTLPDVSTIQNTSFNQHSTSWDASVPIFCQFSVPILDTAARLVSSSFVLRFTPLNATCCGSETKLSGVLLPSTPMLCSTHSRRLPLSFGGVVTSSAMTRVPVGFLTKTIQQLEATDRLQAGRNHMDTRKQNTHAHTSCKAQPKSQSGVQLQRTYQMIQCISFQDSG